MSTAVNTHPAEETKISRRIHSPIDPIILFISGRFGSKAKEVERFLKFAIVGTFGAIVDFGTLNILQHTLLHPEGANETLKVATASGIAFTAAVASNFFWNRYWTYPDSRSRHVGLQLAQFFFINTVAVVVRLIFVSTVYSSLGEFAEHLLGNSNIDSTTANRLGTNLAQAIAVGVAMFWNFFMNRIWTYNDVDKHHHKPAPDSLAAE
ncbi:MAG: GtrA family protein [Chloroflexi bacterium]|nr:GtrA family protein [Chloroflexota bacterium]